MPGGQEFAAPEKERVEKQRASSPAPVVVQRALLVGHSDDPLEHEAEAIAQRVLAGWDVTEGPAAEPASLAVHRVTDSLVSRTTGPAGGYAGGEVDVAAERDLGAALGTGQPLAAPLRRRYEGAFGADFSGVRIHQGSRSADLNQQFGARAFTVGSDIFLGANAPKLDSQDGVRLLSHELTHTLQQGNSVQRIQRDIGFEFETKHVTTRRKNDGQPLQAAEVASYGAINTLIGASSRLPKSKALLKQDGIEVQADDNGTDSDMEVVVDHLPMTPAGRQELSDLMDALDQLFTAAGVLTGPRTSPLVGAEELDGTAGFGTPLAGSYFDGALHLAKTMPQVTLGTRIGNVVDIVEDLHDAPGETLLQSNARKEGRRHMRPDQQGTTDPVAAGGEAQLLSDALVTAKTAIAAYHAINNAAPQFTDAGGKDLAGFLTFIFSYAVSGENKTGFLKNRTPLMAKTDLAAIWDGMPATITTFFGHQDPVTHVTRIEELIETAPNYAARIDTPLMNAAADLAEDEGLSASKKQWYSTLIMRDWVRSIVTPHRTKWQKFKELMGADARTMGIDKLTTKGFEGMPKGQEVEGYGALGEKTDTYTNRHGVETALPVMELRSANRLISYHGAKDWALDMFDYVRSLNRHPSTGTHTRIANAPPA